MGWRWECCGACAGSDGGSWVAAFAEALDPRCEGVELPLRLEVWQFAASGLGMGWAVVSMPARDDLRLGGRDSMELRLEVRLCEMLGGWEAGVSALPERR